MATNDQHGIVGSKGSTGTSRVVEGERVDAAIDCKPVQAEVLPPEPEFLVVGKPHPLKEEVVKCVVKEGTTIAEMLEGLDWSRLSVRVNGFEIKQGGWKHIRPKAGTTMEVVAFPKGEMDEQTAKNVRVVALLVLVVGVALITGPLGIAAFGAVGAPLLGAVVGLGGQLAINALIKTRSPGVKPPVNVNDGMAKSERFSGTNNEVRQYGAVPCVLGEYVFYPPHAALPYSEIVNKQSYVRLLLDLGYGNLDVQDIKIGSYDPSFFPNTTYAIGTNPAGFVQDVFEDQVNNQLADGTTYLETTPPGTNEIHVDIHYPMGFWNEYSNGAVSGNFDWLEIEYRDITAGPTFTPLQDPANHAAVSFDYDAAQPNTPPSFPLVGVSFKDIDTGWPDKYVEQEIYDGDPTIGPVKKYIIIRGPDNKSPFISTFKWKVPTGTYEVKVKRVKVGPESFTGTEVWTQTEGYWGTLRSIKYNGATNLPTTKLAIRIPATVQSNGVIDKISCKVKQQIEVWDGAAWTVGPTKNPAWIFRWLLKDCPANPRHIPTSRIDEATIKLWGAECDAKGFTFSAVVDETSTMFDILTEVAAAGRATFTVKDGKYSVVRDVQQSTPVQHFTPRNSNEFVGNRSFTDEIHALKVRFTNPNANWQQDEMIVYDDGYTSANATKFETMDLPGIVNPDHAWKLARYHLAVGRLRQNEYSFKTDVENLVCNRGDLIKVAHDVPRWGLGWGRVTHVETDPADATIILGVAIDEQLKIRDRTQYALRVRNEAGLSKYETVMPVNEVLNRYSVYTRAGTTGSYFGEDGGLKYVLAANELRLTGDKDGKFAGMLVEDARTNLTNWSEDFTNVYWTKTGAVATGNQLQGPDNTVSADFLREDNSNGEHSVSTTAPFAGATDYDEYTASIFAVKGQRQWLRITIKAKDGTQVHEWFNLQTGKTYLGVGYMEQVGNNYWRCTLTASMQTGGAVPKVTYALAKDAGVLTYQGDNASGLYIFGAQVEIGPRALSPDGATSYIPTAGAIATRSEESFYIPTANLVRWNPSEGTLVVEWESGPGSGHTIFQLDVGDSDAAANCIKLFDDGGDLNFEGPTGGAAIGQEVYRQVNRAACAWKAGDFSASINGDGVTTFASNLPVFGFTKLRLGHRVAAGSRLNGRIRSVRYIPRRCPDAELEQLSLIGSDAGKEEMMIWTVTQTGIKVGDLAMFGALGSETASMIVTRITPGPDLSAVVTCVDEAPAVYNADAGPPPVFVSNITGTPFRPTPDQPVIVAVSSNPNVSPPKGGGVVITSIKVTVKP